MKEFVVPDSLENTPIKPNKLCNNNCNRVDSSQTPDLLSYFKLNSTLDSEASLSQDDLGFVDRSLNKEASQKTKESEDSKLEEIKEKHRTPINENKAILTKNKRKIIDSDDEEDDYKTKDVDLETTKHHFEESPKTPKIVIKNINMDIIEFINKSNKNALVNVLKIKDKLISKIIGSKPLEPDCFDSIFNEKEKTHIIQRYKKYLKNVGVFEDLIKKSKLIEQEINSNKELLKSENFQLDSWNCEYPLKSYQLDGLYWLISLYRSKACGILADEMGLGKSAQVIGLIARLHDKNVTGFNLVIAPSSTLYHWKNEFNKYTSHITTYIYTGIQSEIDTNQQYIVENTPYVIITSYQSLSSNLTRRFFNKLDIKAMILDEGHMIKNFKSARYKDIFKVQCGFKLLVTGTPIQNNLQELISLLVFLMPDMFEKQKEFLDQLFHNKHLVSSSQDHNNELCFVKKARSLLDPFILRRLKSQVFKEFPEKHEHIISCELTKNQEVLYMEQKRKILSQCEDDHSFDQNINNIKYSVADDIELRKVINHPLLCRNIYKDEKLAIIRKLLMRELPYRDYDIDKVNLFLEKCSDFEIHSLCLDHKKLFEHRLQDSDFLECGKMLKTIEIINIHINKKNKILLFSQYTKTLDIIMHVLHSKKITFCRLDGSTPVPEREQIVDSFNNDININVFLLSTKAGGFGINLTSANVVILYDLNYNPTVDQQAVDRVHRLGQPKVVQVYKLFTNNTIEKKVVDLSNLKNNFHETFYNSI